LPRSTASFVVPQSRPETLKVCVSELPLPLVNVVSQTKMFALVNIELGSGVFQGIVASVVATDQPA